MERQEDDIVITIPMVSAIVTAMVTPPPHHAPLACDVLSNLAAVITEKDIDAHGGETVQEIKTIIKFFQDKHPIAGEPRFYVDDDGYIIGEMHPVELWAICVSIEHLKGIMPEDGVVYQTVTTWLTAGEALVTATERFAVDGESGTMVQ